MIYSDDKRKEPPNESRKVISAYKSHVFQAKRCYLMKAMFFLNNVSSKFGF